MGMDNTDTTSKHAAEYAKLMRKVDRFNEARRIAETAFEKLHQSPEWSEFCAANGISEHCDFGDLTC